MLKNLFVASTLIVASGVTLAQYTPQQIHSAIKGAGGPEPFMQEVARQTARTLPTMTNKNVEVSSVSASGLRMYYTTRFINIEKKDVIDIEALKAENTNYLACTSPVMGILIKDYGAEIAYFVTARGREFIFQYNLNKSTCEGR